LIGRRGEPTDGRGKEATMGFEIEVIGAEPAKLADLRGTEIDHTGNTVVPIADREGDFSLVYMHKPLG
jgi:hypothetical protein